MDRLADWIIYGRTDSVSRNKAAFRRLLCAARGHVPVIDRVNYPPVSENSCPLVR